jgi:hypothetical protein
MLIVQIVTLVLLAAIFIPLRAAPLFGPQSNPSLVQSADIAAGSQSNQSVLPPLTLDEVNRLLKQNKKDPQQLSATIAQRGVVFEIDERKGSLPADAHSALGMCAMQQNEFAKSVKGYQVAIASTGEPLFQITIAWQKRTPAKATQRKLSAPCRKHRI